MAGRSQTTGKHTGMILIQTRKPEKKITEQEKRRQGRLKKIKILKKKNTNMHKNVFARQNRISRAGIIKLIKERHRTGEHLRVVNQCKKRGKVRTTT